MSIRPSISGIGIVRGLGTAVSVLALAVGSLLVLKDASPASAQPTAPGGVVVIANGWSPSDIGTAAPLAGRLDAAVLYSSSDSLGTTTVTALERLQPARVVLMGGRAALTDGVAAQVRSAVPGVEVRRLSGTGRVDTAARSALAAPVVSANRPVVIANGWSPPDVGVAAPLADSLGGSVLFAHKRSLGDATVDALQRLRPSRVIIVGGTAALDVGTEAELGSAIPGVPTQRLGGVDRTDTAGQGAELADLAAGSPVVIASGWSSPDVGVAAPLAAAIDGTVLFSYRASLGEYTTAVLQHLAPKQVTLVGDTDAVTREVHAEIAKLLPSTIVQRISGRDRRVTAAKAALYVAGLNMANGSTQKVELSIGAPARIGGWHGSGQGTCTIPDLVGSDFPAKHCYWLDIQLTGFEDTTEYVVSCIYHRHKLTERNRMTWKTGTVTTGQSLDSLCHFGMPNSRAYVEVNGVKSNGLVWECDLRTLYQNCQITSSSP